MIWHWPSPWQWCTAENFKIILFLQRIKITAWKILILDNFTYKCMLGFWNQQQNLRQFWILSVPNYCTLLKDSILGAKKGKNLGLFFLTFDEVSVIMPTAIPSQIIVGLNVDIQRSDGKLSMTFTLFKRKQLTQPSVHTCKLLQCTAARRFEKSKYFFQNNIIWLTMDWLWQEMNDQVQNHNCDAQNVVLSSVMYVLLLDFQTLNCCWYNNVAWS